MSDLQSNDLIIGIDLGTTHSLVGVVDSGFPILLADSDGRRLTPSVVHYPVNGEVIVGTPAARMRAVAPGRTVASVGDLAYYRPFGFERIEPGRITFPGPADPLRILGCELVDGAADDYAGQTRRYVP